MVYPMEDWLYYQWERLMMPKNILEPAIDDWSKILWTYWIEELKYPINELQEE